MINNHFFSILSSRLARKIPYLLECILGATLLFSGMTKAISIQGFAVEITQYCELYVNSALSLWNKELAVMMCGIEILLGVCLFIYRLNPYSIVAAFWLMSFFTYLSGMNYFFPPSFGRIESCGCFGEMIHFTPLGSFLKSIVLLAISMIVIFLVSQEKKENRTNG